MSEEEDYEWTEWLSKKGVVVEILSDGIYGFNTDNYIHGNSYEMLDIVKKYINEYVKRHKTLPNYAFGINPYAVDYEVVIFGEKPVKLPDDDTVVKGYINQGVAAVITVTPKFKHVLLAAEND